MPTRAPDFASALRTRRRDLRLSQADVAAALCVTVQTVSNWECGRVRPWKPDGILDKLVKWAQYRPIEIENKRAPRERQRVGDRI
jgi:DNA-binding transcriptional regulator YiaG